MAKKIQSRLACFLLVLSIMLSGMALGTNAAMTKKTTKRVIGIVFDNSGSMYLNNNTAWSQAQYAMEVFASMMNTGDEFIIFPMHPITIGKGGKKYTADSPYSIKDPSKANTIRNIYTPKAAGTPGKSTTEKALKNLKGKSGEKWLIVLTDGEFEDASLSQQGTLVSKCLKSVNVLYLAMLSDDEKPKAPSAKSSNNHIYSGKVAESSDKVPQMLTQMCNKVFGRDELPPEFISGNNFNIDIPMSKIYVFVQGKNISNISLSGNGKSYTATKVLNPCYGTNGGYATYDNKVYNKYDSSLQGCLTVFENLDACKDKAGYSVQFKGTKSSMSIYYEPDVNLMAEMINPDGTVCMEDQVFTPGDYSLKYYLADKDGREVNSKLLGKTDFEINYKLNNEPKTEKKNALGTIPIHLDENSTFALDNIKAVILSDYRLQKSGNEFGYLSKGITCEKGAAGTLKMTISGGKSSYDPDTLSENAKYKATFTYDGESITGAALDSVKLNCQVQNSSITANATKLDDGYEIDLSTTGKLADIKPGKYVLNCSGTFTTENSKDAYTREDIEFKINDISGKLTATIDFDSSYLTKSELDDNKIILNLALNGKPLTDEQLKNAKIEAITDLPLTTRMLPGKSAYEVSFNTKKGIDTGDYDIELKATNVKDRLGNNLAASDNMELTVGSIPRWLKFLLWIIGLALLALLIWYICTRPALPRKFEEVPCKINYLGKTNEGIAECMVNGNRKRKTINYSCNLDRTQTSDVTFTVIPDKKSYWIKPSAKRKAMIIPEETMANYNVSYVKPYGGTKVTFEKGDIPPKLREKLVDGGHEEFDCDGKFQFSGQTNRGRFDVNFTPEIK